MNMRGTRSAVLPTGSECAVRRWAACCWCCGASLRVKTRSPSSARSSLAFPLSRLYAASTLYHFYQGSDRTLLRLRKLDHSIIYVLIAGSYTPIIWHGMEHQHAAAFLAVIWSIAAVGILVKLCWLSAPRWLYTSLYLLMGWAIVFDWNSLGGFEPGCLALVAAGGIAYSIGAVFYLVKRPVISGNFGFHEIFHLFILAGSLLHFLAVFFFVL